MHTSEDRPWRKRRQLWLVKLLEFQICYKPCASFTCFLFGSISCWGPTKQNHTHAHSITFGLEFNEGWYLCNSCTRPAVFLPFCFVLFFFVIFFILLLLLHLLHCKYSYPAVLVCRCDPFAGSDHHRRHPRRLDSRLLPGLPRNGPHLDNGWSHTCVIRNKNKKATPFDIIYSISLFKSFHVGHSGR